MSNLQQDNIIGTVNKWGESPFYLTKLSLWSDFPQTLKPDILPQTFKTFKLPPYPSLEWFLKVVLPFLVKKIQ